MTSSTDVANTENTIPPVETKSANSGDEAIAFFHVIPNAFGNWYIDFQKFVGEADINDLTNNGNKNETHNGNLNISFVAEHLSFSIYYLLPDGFTFNDSHPFFIDKNAAPINFCYKYYYNQQGLLITFNYLGAPSDLAEFTNLDIQLIAYEDKNPSVIMCSQDPKIGVKGPQ